MGLFKPFIGDVFGLSRIYDLQVENIENKSFASWPESAKYGYFGGGMYTGSICVITRLDFSNEIVSDPGRDFPQSRDRAAVVSNNSYGYFGGGYDAVGRVNTITRLDFSNETVSDLLNKFLTVRGSPAGVSNNSYGYFGGGFAPTASSTITRLDFSNDTVSDPGKNLTDPRNFIRGLSGGASVLRPNKTYGYFVGDRFAPAAISRLDFSNEVVSNPGKTLPSSRSNMATVSNNSYGYFGGGEDGSRINTISRLDFSNETVSDPTKNFLTGRRGSTGVSNNSYGYFGGGYDPSAGGYLCTITRLDFSNETLNNPGKNLPGLGKSIFGGVSNNSYGYFGGGYNPSAPGNQINTISRLDFSNETVSNPGKNLPTSRSFVATVFNNSYGYFGGGYPNSTVNTITRLDFSNEVVSNPTKNLPTSRYGAAGVSNNFCGYFGGGYYSGTNRITKLDFSNENVNNLGSTLLAPTTNTTAVTNSN